MRAVAWFQMVVGSAIALLWVVLLATGQVPEVEQGRVDIWFHLVAELVTAALLVAAGWLLLRCRAAGPMLSAGALGALLYTALNSPGYYAEAGEPGVVLAFGLLVVATSLAGWRLWRAGTDRRKVDG